MDCTIRPMQADEVGLAIEAAAREGWNPGLHDAATFHAADAGGFLIADAGGAMRGCISAVRYGSDFGFVGLYIVAPEWRGQGLGRRLWEAGMARLAGRCVGLDGVPAQQDAYRRSGFASAWVNVRHAGRTVTSGRATPAEIVPAAAVAAAQLAADDRRCFPAPREAFLRAWLAQPDATALAWAAPEGLRGWGVIRRCRTGCKIGPLLADTPAIAESLFTALCDAVPAGTEVFLDVPMPNANGVALALGQGLAPVFETARMYTGPAPACELTRLYGITSFELG